MRNGVERGESAKGGKSEVCASPWGSSKHWYH